MNKTKKEIAKAVLDKVDAWLEGKISITGAVHKTAPTYLGKLEKRIAPEEKKP